MEPGIRIGKDGGKSPDAADGHVNRIKVFVMPDDDGADIPFPHSKLPKAESKNGGRTH
jgi:hypothetical protein